jgi:S-formylglutathione hydrolase FrmB
MRRVGLLLSLVPLLAACAHRPAERRLDAAAPLPPGEGSYRVLLPPGYPAAAPYPVVYYLHDYLATSATLWRQGVVAALEQRMAAGQTPPFVLVAPDGDRSYWADSFDGARRYESWVAGALREEIEGRFAVRRDRDGRAVAGISMGGLGAARLALRRPDLYEAAGSLSGALIPMDWDFVATAPWFIRPNLKRIFGRTAGANNLAANNLKTLLAQEWPGRPERPRFYLRCGTEDKYKLGEAATRFREAAAAAGLEAELVLEPGGHNWRYWRTSAVDFLDWHARRFASPERAQGRVGV